MSEKQVKYVSWVIFCWAIGLIFIVLGYSLNSTSALSIKLGDHQEDDLLIKEQLSQIQTDLGWIKKGLNINEK